MGEVLTETATDLTPILEKLSQLLELQQGVLYTQLIMCGILLGCAVILILAVMWR